MGQVQHLPHRFFNYQFPKSTHFGDAVGKSYQQFIAAKPGQPSVFTVFGWG